MDILNDTAARIAKSERTLKAHVDLDIVGEKLARDIYGDEIIDHVLRQRAEAAEPDRCPHCGKEI